MTAVSPNVAKPLRARLVPLAVMLLTPLFFSSNLIFGRSTIPEVAPFTLAFLRWAAAALLLAPFLWMARDRVRTYVSSHPVHWLVLGFLGMWICGAGVYYALQFTTATNGTLIYTTSPLMIILLESLFFGRPTSWREIAGIVVGFIGVAIIVLQGDVTRLATTSFNWGDLMFIAAALSWAGYSVLLKGRRTAGLPVSALFAVVALSGALLLAPFALWEFLAGAMMPQSWSSLGRHCRHRGVLVALGFFRLPVRGRPAWSLDRKRLHVSPAPYGVGLAVLVLGEPFHATTPSASSPC
jgi:drug/metabolite transporter (DMT)-like permease